MQLVIDIKNENVSNKVLDFLKQFHEKDVKIINKDLLASDDTPDNDYIESHWREIGMGTDSVETDDDQRLYDAAWKFYREKHTD